MFSIFYFSIFQDLLVGFTAVLTVEEVLHEVRCKGAHPLWPLKW